MTKELITDIAWGGGIIVLALAATLARQLGYIDQDTTIRIVLGATGLMVAAYGNRMPKKLVPNERARQAARVGGWSLALSGLVYAVLWAFAPFNVALIGGCAAIIMGMVVTFAYCLSLRNKPRSA